MNHLAYLKRGEAFATFYHEKCKKITCAKNIYLKCIFASTSMLTSANEKFVNIQFFFKPQR